MKKRIVAAILLLMLGSSLAWLLFHLSFAGGITLFVFGICLLPFFEKNRRRGIAEAKEYEEVTMYMEQLLCSYKRYGQMGRAWEDCMLVFEEKSDMRMAIEKALNCLKNGENASSDTIIWSACRCIHEKYDSCRLVLIHEFLCRTEEIGGDIGEAFDILLRELQRWKRRKGIFQAQKRVMKTESVISGALAVIMCCFSRIIMPFDLENQMVTSAWYQISSVAVICLLMAALLISFQKLTGDWLDKREKNPKKEKEQEKKYRILQSGRHGIQWQIAKKCCRQVVQQEFPYWLLSVTLYLQQENLYQSIHYSMRQIHGIFYCEIKKLMQGIYESPSSLLPYMNFFKELELEEVETGMKILYSAGSSEYLDVRRQVHFLVEQNSLVIDQYEKNRQDMQTAGMGVLKQIPLVFAAGKVIIDMAILLIMTLEHYSI
jgi:hypothetical protein